MSDTTADVTPATDDSKAKAPEFEGDFDAEKATRLVTNLREEVAGLKESLASVTADRDAFKEAATKTGEDREKALNDAVKRAEDAERRLAIAKHDLDDETVAEWADYLTGTPEEVEARAAKVAALVKAKAPATPAEPEAPKTPEAPPAPEAPVVPTRPKAALVPGNGADAPKPFDAAAIAAKARG